MNGRQDPPAKEEPLIERILKPLVDPFFQAIDNPGPRLRRNIRFLAGGMSVLGIIFFTTMVFVFGWVIQLLWNATIADMFGLAAISYWQAVGIFILAKILFGFGFGGSSTPSQKKKKKQENALDQDETEPESAGVHDPADEASFQKFWQEEGKQAYEDFRRDDSANDT